MVWENSLKKKICNSIAAHSSLRCTMDSTAWRTEWPKNDIPWLSWLHDGCERRVSRNLRRAVLAISCSASSPCSTRRTDARHNRHRDSIALLLTTAIVANPPLSEGDREANVPIPNPNALIIIQIQNVWFIITFL